MQRSDRILTATVYRWIGNCVMVRFIAIGTMRERSGCMERKFCCL
jgi:hypothetical protein